MATIYRQGCGTHMGLLLHQTNSEEPCAQCRHREMVRLLELEAVPTRPTPPEFDPTTAEIRARDEYGLPPITPGQAYAHRMEMLAALDESPWRRDRA